MRAAYANSKSESLPLIPKRQLNLCLRRSPRSLSVLPRKDCPTNSNITPHHFFPSKPLLSLLEICKNLCQLKQIQAQMTLNGSISDGFATSRLIAFCGVSESANLDYCTKILYNTMNPNAYSWNVAIRRYVESENPEKALVLYNRMMRIGLPRPDNYTHPLLFKACAGLGLNFVGFEILVHVLELGFDNDGFVHNALIHFLASVGDLGMARKVFDKGCVRNLVSWNSLIGGYVRNGKAMEAILMYQEMIKEQIKPDEVTMVGLVSSIVQLQNLKLGREFHHYIQRAGVNLTIRLTNALIDMYVKCGDLEAAKSIFDNMTKKTVVSWTAMVVGYAKLGLLDSAKKFFDDMPEKNVVSWNAIIGSYVWARHSKEALDLFHQMQACNIKPDRVTMVHCLSACSQLGALDVGLWVHYYIEKHNIHLDVTLGTALVDMYAKCGNISRALHIFQGMPRRNSLTWTAIIGGLALNKNTRDALFYFSKMIDIGLLPDEITFLGVLSACCHGGLVIEGRRYFDQMKSKFNLSPQLKHYSSMVDLLGRAGLLEEAEELIKSMPMEADAAVWGALFFACRIHGNLPMGERAASKLLELDPHDSGIYVLLADMYREANMWEESKKVRNLMKERGVEKTPGSSSIEVHGIIYEFIARDTSHPQSQRIYECLVWLAMQLNSQGCFSSIPAAGGDEPLLGIGVETGGALFYT